jgi:hypothetical protein
MLTSFKVLAAWRRKYVIYYLIVRIDLMELSITYTWTLSAKVKDVDISQTSVELESPSDVVATVNKAIIAVRLNGLNFMNYVHRIIG